MNRAPLMVAAISVILVCVLAAGVFFYLGVLHEKARRVDTPHHTSDRELSAKVSPRPIPAPPEALVMKPGAELPPPPTVMTPGNFTTDLATLVLSRYRPSSGSGPGRLDLRLMDLVGRYAPADLRPGGGYVYAISPAAVRFASVLFANVLLEKLRAEALAAQAPDVGLTPEQSADLLRATADWLRAAAQCPQTARNGAPFPDVLDKRDCREAMDWVHGVLDKGNIAEVEATASDILENFAARVEQCAPDMLTRKSGE